MPEINSRIELEEAKKKLERLVDIHQYNQMLAGSSRLPIDPEIGWLKSAIDKYEAENKFSSDYLNSYSNYMTDSD
jgi:hypothetical protein